MSTHKKGGRKRRIDYAEVVKLILSGKTIDTVAQLTEVHRNNICNIFRKETGESITALRKRQAKLAGGYHIGGGAAPAMAKTVPLSAGMRHLAQFDSIIAARLEREKGAALE